ncbi:hypothetical protein LNP18_06465 [Leuconostoc citreum]|uniref:hypothetical protein n=1 Tax=Leuconostoc citreum TaxID=33964 RepID=UPI00200B9E88|nr:hypothetical protein [Leuconostoc citreum]MCK8605747.1 hypothetical protein [Leuconostoc citreum]
MKQNNNDLEIINQLRGIQSQIKRIKHLLDDLKTNHFDPLTTDIDALSHQVEVSDNRDIVHLFNDFFDTDTINFLANINGPDKRSSAI